MLTFAFIWSMLPSPTWPTNSLHPHNTPDSNAFWITDPNSSQCYSFPLLFHLIWGAYALTILIISWFNGILVLISLSHLWSTCEMPFFSSGSWMLPNPFCFLSLLWWSSLYPLPIFFAFYPSFCCLQLLIPLCSIRSSCFMLLLSNCQHLLS